MPAVTAIATAPQSTTRTVVLSSILILVTDYFLTQILLSIFAP